MNDDILRVREFNIIVSEKSAQKNDCEDERVHSLDSDAFEELKEFISSADDQVDDISAIGKLSSNGVLGDYVTLQNYIGLIELPCGKQIEVIPKIDLADSTEGKSIDRISKRIMMDMLECYFGNKFKVSGMAKLDSDDTSLYEIFINMYVEEARELVRHGLKATYIRNEDNLSLLKGKLLFNEHIRYNTAHKERFYVAYDEYDINRPINKLIKSTLIKLLKESKEDYNRKNIKFLLAHFVDVEESSNYDKDFSSVVMDRTLQDYEQLIEWSRIFLYDQSFSNFTGDTGAKALLFPMEELFECYVAEKLQNVVKAAGYNWHVSAQAREKHLFQRLNGKKNRKFLLKPDILIKNPEQDKLNIVMDTKWKRLINNAGYHYGIKPADMYQMFVYSKRYHAKHIWLLYPYNENVKDLIKEQNNNIIFQGFEDDDSQLLLDVSIHVFFVDMENIEDSLNHLLKVIALEKIWDK